MIDSSRPIVVLGAGPAGLGAAYWLARAGKPVIVLEKAPRVGGMGASVKHKEYIADYGPHTFHLKDSVVTKLFESLAGPDCNKVQRNAKVWLKGKLMPFPLRPVDAASNLSPLLVSRIAADYAFEHSVGRLRRGPGWEARTFEEWGINHFGHTLYRLAFGNYSEKMWGLSGRQLSAKLAKQKLQGISLKEMVLAMFGLIKKEKADAIGLSHDTLYDAYPREGIGSFFNSLAQRVTKFGGQIHLNAKPTKITHAGNTVTSVTWIGDDGEVTADCSAVLSSIPLPLACPLLDSEEFSDAQSAASGLKYRSLRCVHMILRNERFSDAHWIYMLDDRLYGNRLSEQKNLSLNSCPPNQTVVCIDYTCDYDDYIWNADESFMIGLAMSDLSVMGLHPRVILDAFVMNAPHVYPIYSLGFEENMKRILDDLSRLSNFYSFGRHGLLLNNDMHDSMEMGFMVSQLHSEGLSPLEWYKTSSRYIRERLEGYVRDPIKFSEKGAPIERNR